MTTKQKNEEYQATLTAQMEEVKGLLIKANERAEDQARTITKLNQDALQARKQQDGEGIAWEANSSKNYDYFGSFTLAGVEHGICLTSTWKNSDRQIQSKAGKKGQRLFVFPFKTEVDTEEPPADHDDDDDVAVKKPFVYNQVPDNDAENGRYDNVVVNKDHSLDDGDKPTHERGE